MLFFWPCGHRRAHGNRNTQMDESRCCACHDWDTFASKRSNPISPEDEVLWKNLRAAVLLGEVECSFPGCWRTGGLHIDHDHKTGRVRGILCDYHNIRIMSLFERWGSRLEEIFAWAKAHLAGELRDCLPERSDGQPRWRTFEGKEQKVRRKCPCGCPLYAENPELRQLCLACQEREGAK